MTAWSCCQAQESKALRQPRSSERNRVGLTRYNCDGTLSVRLCHTTPAAKITFCHGCAHPQYAEVCLTPEQKVHMDSFAHLWDVPSQMYQSMIAPENDEAVKGTKTHLLLRQSVVRYCREQTAHQWRFNSDPKTSIGKLLPKFQDTAMPIQFDEAKLPRAWVASFVLPTVIAKVRSTLEQVVPDRRKKMHRSVPSAPLPCPAWQPRRPLELRTLCCGLQRAVQEDLQRQTNI